VSKKNQKAKKRKSIKSQKVKKPGFLKRAKEGFLKKKLIYTYCIGFILLVGFFAWMQNTDWFKSSLDPILNLYALISSGVLNILGQGTSAIQQTVNSENFSVNIKQGCDAIAPMLLYLSAVVLYPISYRYKWQGLLGGIAVLFILNIIRIVTLYLSGVYGSMAFFDFMHIEFWQVLYVILTVIVWIMWIRWANQRSKLQHG